MDIAGLPLVGGHPALDLVNTVERGTPTPGSRPRDFLESTDDLVVWSGRVELLSDAEADAVLAAWSGARASTAQVLPRLRELREAVHRLTLREPVVAGQDAAEMRSALDLLGRRWAESTTRSHLRSATVPGEPLVLEVGTDPAHLIEDRLADQAVGLLRGPNAARIHTCPIEQGGCGWVFLDHSRNSSRTWCRMADCGNQVKARRLTERRRALRTAAQSGR